MWTRHFISCAQLWDVGGNWSPRRKPLQTWGEHVNSIQRVASAGNRTFSYQCCNERMLFEDLLYSKLSMAVKTRWTSSSFYTTHGKNCSLICRAAAYILLTQSIIVCILAFRVSKVSLVTLLFAHMILSVHLLN